MNSASRTCPNAPISSRVSRTAGPDVTHHGEPGPRADDHGPDPQKCETSDIQHDGPNVSKPAMGLAELEWFTVRRVR
jgi:hypothetical protein